MKKYLWLILIVCVLLTCTLTVAAVSGTETPVVYLNGEVETAGDGSSASSPVKTLAAAYAVLNGGDGTIVLCGNISVSANKTDATANSAFSATTGNILYTGKDPVSGTEYNPVITITGTNNDLTIVEFLTTTEFSYVTFNATTNKTPYLVSGPSLTMGEGVVFKYKGDLLTSTTTDTFGIRVGSYVSKINGKYTQKSGTIGSVYGGGTKGAGTSEINISGTAKVLVRLEAGGRQAKVDTSTINISGQAEVNTLLFGGYKSSVGSVTANISGGKVNSVVTSRETTASATVDIATLTISDSAKVGSITLDSRNANGNNTLTISNNQTLTENFGAYWDTINIGSYADVELNGTYDGTGTLKVDGRLTLNANMNEQTVVDALADANTGSGRIVSSGAVVDNPVTVYLDGSDGADTNGGTSAGDAVKTLAKAYELMDGNSGTIVICGDLEIASSDLNNTSAFSVKFGNVVYTGKDPVTSEIYPVKITVVDGTDTDLVQIFTPTVFEYLTFDACTNRSTMFVTGKSLTFGEGMTFLRDGKLITNTTSDEIVVRLGSKTEKIAPTFIMKSGVISSVYGGNQFKDSGKTTVKISGDSQILVRLECGANGRDGTGYVEEMNLTISDDVYINTLNLTGFSNGNLGTSNTTITGGYIAKIWGQRDSNNGKTNKLTNLNVTISGDTYFEEIDLGGIEITGTATLTIGELADDLVFTMFDEYWDKIIISENVKLHLAGEYPAGVPLEVRQNAVLYLDSQTNSAVPTYTGSGLVVRDEHNHTLTHVEAFCGENGVLEHWCCDQEGCPGNGNRYADANGTTPVSKSSVETGGEHPLENLIPVCTGETYYRCTVCHAYFEDKEAEHELTEQEYLQLSGHHVVKVAVKAPTCTEDGVLEAHWHCENCNWNFRDEACTDLIKYSVIDPKTGHHELKPVEAKAPTCTEDGCIAHYACEDCGKTYTSALYFRSRLPLSAEQVTVKARHTLTYVDPVPATDDAHGVAGYWTCKVDTCDNYGKRFADEEGAKVVTDADLVTHKLTEVKAKEATATDPGHKAHWICASCDKVFSDAEGKTEITLASTVIPATGSTQESKPQETTKPEETTKPAQPGTNTPDTGDRAAILAAAMLVLLSGTGIALATELKRRWR